MKRFLAGILAGIVITLLAEFVWFRFGHLLVTTESALFTMGRGVVEQALPGARVLDVSFSPNSTAQVNYVYDKLFDVHVSYERNGQVKNITAPFGVYHGQWICPNVTDLTLLDAKAKGISLSQQPPNTPGHP
jgi:hypothetical protein